MTPEVALHGPAITPARAPAGEALQRLVARAALAALTLANAVGVWLAALLLWPRLGAVAGPLTYGRWVPVHLDLQLYGWCSLPLIGLLLARFLPPAAVAAPGVHRRWLDLAHVAVAVWWGALAAGALAWLGGHSSGKLFLEWSGPAGVAFTVAQVFLWFVLAAAWWARGRLAADSRRRRAADAALLLVLATVPAILVFVEQPGLNPPVDPHSGGATGHSLLASTLAIIGIALLLPPLCGRPARHRHLGRAATIVLAMFGANWIAYSLVHHGNASNLDPTQVAGLATLLPWPAWLAWWYRRFHWEPAQVRWLQTAAAWAALLVLDGFLTFLPGVLERAKFTNALVGHAHLAMAGVCTSLNVLLLVSLAPRSRLARTLAARGPWLAWNLGCLVMIVGLTWLGWDEGANPWLLFDGSTEATLGYAVRLGAGVAMTAAGLYWWARTWERSERVGEATHAG